MPNSLAEQVDALRGRIEILEAENEQLREAALDESVAPVLAA